MADKRAALAISEVVLAQSLPIDKLCPVAAAAVAARPFWVMLCPSARGSRERNLKLSVLKAEQPKGWEWEGICPFGMVFF